MMTTEIQSILAEARNLGTVAKQHGLPRTARQNAELMRLYESEMIQMSKARQIRLFLAFYQAYDNATAAESTLV